jgi:hypothetical protein
LGERAKGPHSVHPCGRLQPGFYRYNAAYSSQRSMLSCDNLPRW